MNISSSAGNILVILSFAISVAATVAMVLSAAGRDRFSRPADILCRIAGAGIALAAVLLFYYFIEGDYRFAYVFDNSSRDLPLAYRTAAFWAGKEGSFLLWLLFLNLFGLLVIRKRGAGSEIAASIILLSQIFILIILIVESPFAYIWDKYPESISPGTAPGDGAGLNPLLKDPWMVAHPPVLFLGYASSTVIFAFAVAALVKKDCHTWLSTAYPWLLFSMVTLGIGIFLGGYWAYTVLGWGGYWGWDPVENSSLIPWLISIALVHGFLIQRRNGTLARTNIVLALVYFITVFYSTWLTRSGVLSDFSVHSFAASEVATALLIFMLSYVVGAAVIFFLRVRTIGGEKLDAPFLDWKTMTVYGIIVLMVYAIIILGGTSMPLLSQLFMARPTNVTTSFYNNFSMPLGIIMLVLMVAATTLILTKGNDILKKETIISFVGALILGIAINWGFTLSIPAYLYSILAFFVVAQAIADIWKSRSAVVLPSRLAHIGIGLLILGIITSNFHTMSFQKKLDYGTKASVDSMYITFSGVTEGKESRLRFTVQRGQRTDAIDTAYYFHEKTQSIYKEPYIFAGFFNDTYIAPENYESGSDSITNLVIGKGEEKKFSGLTVVFTGFRTEHMTSGEPSTYADITINGIPLSPGIVFSRGAMRSKDCQIPGTDRSVSLRDIDATSKKILLHITPGKNIPVPADSVMISVTVKRLIWLVWLGTFCIACGGGYGLLRSLRSGK